MDFSSWYDKVTDTAKNVIKQMMILMNPVAAAGQSAAKLAQATKDWYANFNELKTVNPRKLSIPLRAERTRLLKRGNWIIEGLKKLGMGADFATAQLNGAPIVGIVTITSAAGLMLYWTYDFIKFKDKLAEYRAARASGASVSEATNLVDSLDGGFLSGLNPVIKTVSIASIVFVGYRVAKSQKWIK